MQVPLVDLIIGTATAVWGSKLPKGNMRFSSQDSLYRDMHNDSVKSGMRHHAADTCGIYLNAVAEETRSS